MSSHPSISKFQTVLTVSLSLSTISFSCDMAMLSLRPLKDCSLWIIPSAFAVTVLHHFLLFRHLRHQSNLPHKIPRRLSDTLFIPFVAWLAAVNFTSFLYLLWYSLSFIAGGKPSFSIRETMPLVGGIVAILEAGVLLEVWRQCIMISEESIMSSRPSLSKFQTVLIVSLSLSTISFSYDMVMLGYSSRWLVPSAFAVTILHHFLLFRHLHHQSTPPHKIPRRLSDTLFIPFVAWLAAADLTSFLRLLGYFVSCFVGDEPTFSIRETMPLVGEIIAILEAGVLLEVWRQCIKISEESIMSSHPSISKFQPVLMVSLSLSTISFGCDMAMLSLRPLEDCSLWIVPSAFAVTILHHFLLFRHLRHQSNPPHKIPRRLSDILYIPFVAWLAAAHWIFFFSLFYSFAQPRLSTRERMPLVGGIVAVFEAGVLFEVWRRCVMISKESISTDRLFTRVEAHPQLDKQNASALKTL